MNVVKRFESGDPGLTFGHDYEFQMIRDIFTVTDFGAAFINALNGVANDAEVALLKATYKTTSKRQKKDIRHALSHQGVKP